MGKASATKRERRQNPLDDNELVTVSGVITRRERRELEEFAKLVGKSNAQVIRTAVSVYLVQVLQARHMLNERKEVMFGEADPTVRRHQIEHALDVVRSRWRNGSVAEIEAMETRPNTERH